MSYYTKNEIAKICGVSASAIDKKLRASGLIDQCPKVANRLQIPWEVAATVATSYLVTLQPQQPKVAEVAEVVATSATVATTSTATKTDEKTLIESLTRELEILHKQLEIKDKQISDLSSALVFAQESNKALSANAAIHTAADKKAEIAIENREQKKRGLLARIFGY